METKKKHIIIGGLSYSLNISGSSGTRNQYKHYFFFQKGFLFYYILLNEVQMLDYFEEALEEAPVIRAAKRYDVKGGSIIGLRALHPMNIF